MQAGLKLEVIAGAHRGAVLSLDGSEYRIGSSPAADIVLSDPGVAAEHAVLRIDRGRVRLEAVGADMTVGQDPLPSSRGSHITLPVSFSLGAAQIHLSDLGQDPGRSARHPLAVAGALACAGLMIALIAHEFLRTAGIAGRGLETVSPHIRADRNDAHGDSISPPPANPSTAEGGSPSRASVQGTMDALKARIDAAHIRTLQISAEDGRLVATGTLTGADAAEWAAIQQWFDKTYGGSAVLASRIGPPGGPPAMPALQLQAVWYGENPYIVTGDGGHYYKGALLDSGWVVRDIGEDRLVLAKGGETVVLTYR
jgi:Inner membrane component of T3SS, cytoplasmic domain/YscD/CdsD-like Bon-like domain 3